MRVRVRVRAGARVRDEGGHLLEGGRVDDLDALVCGARDDLRAIELPARAVDAPRVHLALDEQRRLLAIEDRQHLRESGASAARCTAAGGCCGGCCGGRRIAEVRRCGGAAARRRGGAEMRNTHAARPAHLVRADGEELLAVWRVAHAVGEALVRLGRALELEGRSLVEVDLCTYNMHMQHAHAACANACVYIHKHATARRL